MWCVYTMEYYAVTKGVALVTNAELWMELADVLADRSLRLNLAPLASALI